MKYILAASKMVCLHELGISLRSDWLLSGMGPGKVHNVIINPSSSSWHCAKIQH